MATKAVSSSARILASTCACAALPSRRARRAQGLNPLLQTSVAASGLNVASSDSGSSSVMLQRRFVVAQGTPTAVTDRNLHVGTICEQTRRFNL
ncbi:unnamed protein product [Urochloa humidicola]